jgi:hypothetical protein
MTGAALDGPYRISLYRVVPDGVTPPDSGLGARHDLLPGEPFTDPVHRVEFRSPTDDALLAAFDLVHCEPNYNPNWNDDPNPSIGAIVTQAASMTKILGALVTGLRLSHKKEQSARFLDLIRVTFWLKPADANNWILDPSAKSGILVGYGADPTSKCQFSTLTELLKADFSGIGVFEPSSLTTPTLNLDAAQKLWPLPRDDNPHSRWDPIAFKFIADERGIRLRYTRVLGQHNSDGSLKNSCQIFLDAAGCATDVVVHPLAIAQTDGEPGLTLTLAQPSDSDRLNYRAVGGRKHLDWVLTVESVEAAHLARFFDAGIARPYIESLINVRDGHRVSLLPVLTAEAGNDSTTGRYRLQYLATDTLAHVSLFDSDNDIPKIYIGQAINWRSPDRWRLLPLTASQVRPGSSKPRFTLQLPGLRTHEGAPLIRSMLLEPPDQNPPAVAPNDVGTEFTLTFTNDPNGHPAPASTARTVRMGAFDIEFSAAAKAAGERLQITTSIDDRDWPRDGSQGWAAAVHRLSVSANFALSDAQPGAQDPLPDELLSAQFLFSKVERKTLGRDAQQRENAIEKALQRTPALVFPMQAPDSETGVHYFLTGEELTVPGQSQSLGLKLRKNPDYAAKDAPLSTIVIDSSPFTIASVMMRSLSQATDDTGADIANWSLGESAGAYWQLAGISAGFTLLFPPQGIGEETYKPGAYESNGKVTFLDGPIDFRFSPNAQFILQSSYYEQNFNEAPWNLRRVLGYAGERAPGASVESASFELLYGLSCSIAPPSTRLSELEARLGAPQQPLRPHPAGKPDGKAFPSPPPSAPDPVRIKLESVYQDRRKAWAETLSAYRKRVALFELWREGAADEPFSLDTNIDFTIRMSADLAFPIDPALSTPKEDRWKKVPTELTDTWNNNSGLNGGVLWGFESANILEELLGNTKSTAGLISQPAFSALGGWGYEKAAFSKNKTKIYANTAMGRTFFYSVERIGRIGGCWHRAKHVIVYERTVLPSEQFWPHDAGVPPKPLADQHSLQAGRPLLRKILEYVEPIERKRAYPEGSESPACAAFLDEIEFKDERIPVKSDWGRDIEGGWVIPLWKPDEDPQIYPKPHVVAHMHGDSQGIAVRVACPFASPDELLFYTTTDPNLDDNTDLWPPVETVDHCNAAAPLPDNLAPLDTADPDGRLADAQALDRGHAALTFSLDPPAVPVNLVASRSAKAMNFVPRNFTISRAKPRRTGLSPVAQGISAVAEIRRTIDARKADILNGLDSVTGKTIARAREKVDRFKADIQTLTADVHKISGALTPPVDLCAPLETFAGAAIDAYAKAGADQVKKIAQGLKDEISSLVSTAPAPRRIIDDVTQQLSVLSRPLELPLQATAAALTDAKNSLKDCLDRCDRLISTAKDDLAKIKSDIDGNAASLEEGASRTGETLDTLRTQIGAELSSIHRLLRNADGGGWITGPAQIADDLESGIDAAFGDLKASSSAFSSATTQTNAQFDALIDGGTNILGAMTVAADKALHDLDDLQTKLSSATGAVTAKLNDLRAAVFNLGDAIAWNAALTVDTLDKNIDAFVSQIDENIRGASRAIKDALHNALHDPSDLCTLLFGVKEIKDAQDWINNHLDSLAGGLSNELTSLLSGASTDAQTLRNQIAAGIDGLAGNLAQIDDKAMSWLKQLDRVPTFADPDGTLRMIRAFGDAPVVPDLKFNRDRMAYFFDDLRSEVITSPAAALLNRAGEDLKALGVRIPTQSLLDRVVPDELQNFDVSKIFSDLGGLKFANMFPDLKMPQISNSNIRVTHRFDKATQTGWVHADLDVPFSGRAKVFAYGPVELYLQSAALTATADVSARLGQSPQQEVHGEISGDWQMTLGGTLIMTFVKTSLSFDHTGKLHFDISADRVKLDPSLEWLSDLVAALSDPDSGFSVELVPMGGIRCTLDLPLPPVGAGVFAVAGIRLGASFEVGLFPEFYLAIGFNFSRKTYPFTLTIAFLNGGGWIEATAKYFPSTGDIATSVTIGIVAGAGIEFSFGPFEGAVYVEFGIFVDFYSDDKGGALIVGVMILVRGCVNFFSIVNISICLLIQATYDGKQLIGTGTLTASVQICWCLTLSAAVAVQYTFAGGQGSQSSSTSAAVTGPEVQENLFDD